MYRILQYILHYSSLPFVFPTGRTFRVINVPLISRAFTSRFAHNSSTLQCELERAKIRKPGRPVGAFSSFSVPRSFFIRITASATRPSRNESNVNSR